MLRIFFYLIILANFASCADHNLFKNCSRVEFCRSLRDPKVTSPFKPQLSKLTVNNDKTTVIVPISNSDNQTFNVYINLLRNHTVRMKILETESARYDSLREARASSSFKPQLSKLTVNNDKTTVIVPISNSDHQTFNVYINLLRNHTVRMKILETKSTRYELKDVLDKEPTKLKVVLNKTMYENGSVTILPDDSKYSHSVNINPDPFQIKFFYDDGMLESVFHGEELIFQKDTQAFVFRFQFTDATTLHGLHHHTLGLDLPDTKASKMDPIRLRNSDIGGYEPNSPMAMYGAVPLVYGHTGVYTSGVFLHNAAEQWVDIIHDADSSSARFMVERGALDLFVLLGNTAKETVRQFVELTGRAHMPQLWTLGYHQCRYSYETQEDAKDVVAQMDAYKFPMDAIWLDIDYTDGYRYFTWNPVNFSDPIGFQKNISSTNRKLVTILDPHIKKDPDYPVYAGAKGKYFVKFANGSDYEGVCWPGESSYFDFLDPEARDYYASWHSYEKFNGSTPVLAGVWNDMNEPAVFDDTTEKTMPFDDAVHYGNVAHGNIHNIYGFLQTKATHQGLMNRDNTKRPFILTRSHFAGSQRYAAMWTGDNTADWPYLRTSYSECMLSNIVGMVFCGADIGGFFNDPEPELLQRWYQAGIWLPFYRGHANKDTKRREPYLFGNDVQEVIRTAIKTRYKHLPVLYTLFYEHTRYGDPIVRPLFYEYPGLVNKDDHILLGTDILARPVLENGTNSVNIHFPGDSSTFWYRMDDHSAKIYKGNDDVTLPVNITTSPYFYRAGSIIVRKDLERKSTTDMIDDPVTLYINLDSSHKATGRMYVDDYTSFNYQDKKHYYYLKIEYIPQTGRIVFKQIDGNAAGFEVEISHVIVQAKNSDENTFTRTEYTTHANGERLSNFKITPHLNKKKKVFCNLKNTPRNTDYVLYL
ncbi:unnamed protein product [Phyllotreta striolata]|uniref:Glucosidase II subunit alpha n=1 Tax=Phyllotreta striolata TaxID=444603 RepID=A0A9P0DQ71_PHYSR|nr:unnamed protein product [Phyllotreta striolata]